MTTAIIIWAHALVALICGATAIRVRGAAALPRRAVAVALGLTALWALAVAGIDGRDVTARLAETARNVSWLAVMLALLARGRVRRWSPVLVHGIVMLVAGGAGALALVVLVVRDAATLAQVTGTLVAFRMMTAASALVLMRELLLINVGPARGGARLVAIGLAALWTTDLLLFTAGYLAPGQTPQLIAMRGVAMVPITVLIAAGARRDQDWQLSMSRTVTTSALGILALALYAGLVAAMTAIAGELWGDQARVAQTAIVFGATTALLTFASTPWLRSWAKVMVAKHLFQHRYDYRAEWQRFAETLGQPGDATAPLATRIVKAVAELTASPAGLLLAADGACLTPGAIWAWEDAGFPSAGDAGIASYLAQSHRIVELDDVRGDRALAAEAAAVPQWMVAREDAWALVPLLHADALVGAILLARPLVDRKLDWEDLDLLRVAGRQAASYLAEERAHLALADARRFDEFNRRFAFILHDIKNLASQLSLVARNAERHADNPAFRADMIETLRHSADQMTALLARLAPQPVLHAARPGPVDLTALAARLAGEHRAGHPVVAQAPMPVWAAADPARLEQVLRHLIRNAIEASPPAEPVVLGVGLHAGRALIEVTDRGTGMAPGFVRDQLFRPFVSTKPGGFGLGAYEARQLVEQIGGALDVTSREGEGSAFRVLLPLAAATELAA